MKIYEDTNLCDVAIKHLQDTGMSKTDLANQIGISRSLLSRYLGGTYESDPSTVETALRAYFESLEDKAEQTYIEDMTNETNDEAINIEPVKLFEFFESTDAANITGLCKLCHEFMGLGIVVGKSGYGKTYTLKRYSLKGKVCYLECDDSMTCRDLIEAIERVIGIPKGGGTIWNRVQGIKEFFTVNEGYLLIIDEADKLMTKYSAKKMEILRTIFDQCDVGVVVAGEPALETMLKVYLPRFANRADYFVKMRGLTPSEIKEYLNNFTVTDEALNELIGRGTNSTTGCFRLLNRTLKNLINVKQSKEHSNEIINDNDIKTASNMMML